MVRVITVKPKDMSDETIKARLDGLKQEIKDNESEIKELEDELERRRQEIPLGIPCEGPFHLSSYNAVEACCFRAQSLHYNSFNSFSTKESAEKHAEMLLAWRMALVANYKGEPIDITVLLPLLKKGYVAMDRDGDWFWYGRKPHKDSENWISGGSVMELHAFNLKPAENWETSLMECGL